MSCRSQMAGAMLLAPREVSARAAHVLLVIQAKAATAEAIRVAARLVSPRLGVVKEVLRAKIALAPGLAEEERIRKISPLHLAQRLMVC